MAPLLHGLLAKDVKDRPPVEDVRRQLSDVIDPPDVAEPVAAAPTPTAELSIEDVIPAPPPAAQAPPAPAAEPPAPVSPSRAPPAPALPPQPPPRAAMPARPRHAPRRRSGSAVASVAIVAAIALLAVLATAFLNDRNRPESAAPETVPTTAATTEATTEARGQESRAVVPRNWVSYRDLATGFSVSHPPDWTVRTNGTLTDIRDPKSGAYLRIDYKQPPGPSPEGAWFELEPSFAAEYPTYQRVRIAPTTFKGYRAAVWEFTYEDGGASLHAVDLGFIAANYGFALNFQTHAEDWAAMQPIFEQFKESFKAPS